MSYKVAVLGKGELAIHVCDYIRKTELYNLRWVIPVVPEPSWTKSLLNYCQFHDLNFRTDGCHEVIEDDVDLIISVFYNKILKPGFIESHKKIINIHNGPLPKYRGVAPINWALKNGETEHGITIHEITPGIDDGPIIAQLKYSIYPDFDEVVDVYNRAIQYGKVLFDQTMPIINKITSRPQSGTPLYYSSKDYHLLGDRRNFTKKTSV